MSSAPKGRKDIAGTSIPIPEPVQEPLSPHGTFVSQSPLANWNVGADRLCVLRPDGFILLRNKIFTLLASSGNSRCTCLCGHQYANVEDAARCLFIHGRDAAAALVADTLGSYTRAPGGLWLSRGEKCSGCGSEGEGSKYK